jgi:serine/threonine protein phosphatase PrpC
MQTYYKKNHEENSVIIGLAEIIGGRPTQEDFLAVAVESVKQFPQLSPAEQDEVKIKSFADVNSLCRFDYHTGSTGCVTTAWLDDSNTVHACTGNLGDSTAFLIVINEAENTVASAELLNKIHTPDPEKNREEHDRITAHANAKKTRKFPYKEKGDIWRIGPNGIAMTRSFGDVRYEAYGLTHNAEATNKLLALSCGQSAFIVVACDGLTEEDDNDKDILSPQEIGDIVNGSRKQELVDIASELIDKASKKGSTDNISVALFPISKTPTSAAVFDGHGGIEVSQKASKLFYFFLKKRIEEKLNLKNAPAVEFDIKPENSAPSFKKR